MYEIIGYDFIHRKVHTFPSAKLVEVYVSNGGFT